MDAFAVRHYYFTAFYVANLRNELIADNAVFQTSIDSEVIAVLINSLSDGDVIKGVKRACAKLQGTCPMAMSPSGSSSKAPFANTSGTSPIPL